MTRGFLLEFASLYHSPLHWSPSSSAQIAPTILRFCYLTDGISQLVYESWVFFFLQCILIGELNCRSNAVEPVLQRIAIVSSFFFFFFFVFFSKTLPVVWNKFVELLGFSCLAVGIRYGKYCGVGWSGCPGERPCDDLDACCKIHDECVEKKGIIY